MAKLGEGDDRWIVQERADGANCNNWHWTTKDMTARVKAELSEKMRALKFSGELLEGCHITSDEITGEASVNNRKGSVFLMYELGVKLSFEAVWQGESVKGSLRFADVSPTEIDDLECRMELVESVGSGSTLAQTMRTEGASFVKQGMKKAMLDLQDEVRASAAEHMPVSSGAAPLKAPLPTPLKMDEAAVSAAASAYAVKGAAAARGAGGKDAGGSGDEEGDVPDLADLGDDEDEAPPPLLREALQRLRLGSAGRALHLSNCGLRDVHLPPLIDALAGLAGGQSAGSLRTLRNPMPRESDPVQPPSCATQSRSTLWAHCEDPTRGRVE
jgi:hypothetical protein